MDLKDFVASSLQQIAEGILEAGDALKDTNAVVNPAKIRVNSGDSQAYGRTASNALANPDSESRVVEKVSFDVAVTVQEGTETQAGIKVSVMSFGLGAGGQSNAASGSESRISFSIPMVFPTHEG
ncbi:hypothetical protein [Perlucidibaca aquatica]|uniref:hypothetical protein n=1 Tax=Perlucidibaca aquatica TaxID=1852776 RepID=UPI00083A0662|nr:hypothetical protein [Perlucidibaca aquatica]